MKKHKDPNYVVRVEKGYRKKSMVQRLFKTLKQTGTTRKKKNTKSKLKKC